MPDEKPSDRRRARRYGLIDTVQFAEVRAPSPTQARISDVSLTGCYIETMNPPPVGAQVKVRLSVHNHSFEAVATVVRAEPHMGMAVHFTELPPTDKESLEKLLSELAGQS